MIDRAELALTDREFARIKDRVYRIAGISLSDTKRTLVVSRLGKIVRGLELGSFDAYVDWLESTADAGEQQEFVNALTTNLTRFWREEHHFSHLVEHIRAQMRHPARHSPDGRPRIRIWSAGCSTGQEPYTIALDLRASVPEIRNADFRVLATDIDTAVLSKAAVGIYPRSDLHDLSRARASMFETLRDGRIRIPDSVRAIVTFKVLNLMDPWPMRGPFDAIFCRNVAIYFDRPTQLQLFERLGTMLAPDAPLYLGHSENISSEQFKVAGTTTYQLRPVRKRDAA